LEPARRRTRSGPELKTPEPTAHGPLDVATVPARPGSFKELRGRAKEVGLDGLTVPVAGLDDLPALKREAGRPQGLAEIELPESLPDQEEPSAGG